MVTMVAKDMHQSVSTEYWTSLRGPGYGNGYNHQGYRCRVMGYVTTPAQSTSDPQHGSWTRCLPSSFEPPKAIPDGTVRLRADQVLMVDSRLQEGYEDLYN